ncbi:uncharacterized protein ASPGLDRAFT_44913 [Aspergillus glaucus CBS 516.65]|uniref:Uncharacterized protein n=1 Tax=Aspergillus glaucus CBS 516.65 TaxID=1160497 RepID=A0A1L9VPX4_ASPGL|nr:hypothetical protein ASPGLDRAFT_44913 [Aspergillus glaucus CBS 516.65]OJJ85942.1 hypothetical protein ASPGLDRAFT_44913 [Aspergillus glaucus CBS 516.65]
MQHQCVLLSNSGGSSERFSSHCTGDDGAEISQVLNTAMFSSTVQTRQDPGCAILRRVKAGAGLPGLPNTARLIPKAVRFMLEMGLLSQFQTLPTTYQVTATDKKQPAA